MSDQPGSGLAMRVVDAAGRTVGVGVLVGSREILTCAHVVNAALGRERRAQDRPVDEVTVEPAGGDGTPLRARVQRWPPPPCTGAAGDDIAGLMLTGTGLPVGCPPRAPGREPACAGPGGGRVRLPRYSAARGRRLVEATVRGLVGGGYLQLDSTTDTALRIQPGFSGSPVYDRISNRVVGLLAVAPLAASGGAGQLCHHRRPAAAGLASSTRSSARPDPRPDPRPDRRTGRSRGWRAGDAARVGSSVLSSRCPISRWWWPG